MEKQTNIAIDQLQPRFIVAEPLPSMMLASYQELVGGALDFCGQKTRLKGREAIAQALQEGDRATHEYFRYGLAKEVGNYLGQAQAAVKAVYLYDSEHMPGEVVNGKGPNLTKGLDLVVCVDGPKHPLTPLVQDLDRGLVDEYKALLGPAASSLRSFLSVDVVDDDDVRRRAGRAALLTSLHTRPTKVWSRYVIHLNAEHCGRCLICATVCPYDAISLSPDATAAKIDLNKCQRCGICYSACPAGAIESAYYDFTSLVHDVQSSVRTTGVTTIALTCRGSTPTPQEIEKMVGQPGFVPICLPCVGRTPTEFFLKALDMGIERIAVIPCQDDHCRFEEGSRNLRSRIVLLKSVLQALNYDADVLTIHEAQAHVAMVNRDLCTGCGTCMSVCPYHAIRADNGNGHLLSTAVVDPTLCQGCGICAASCPSRAITMTQFADDELLAQIEDTLATMPQGTMPRILGFRCNWCDYEDADLPFEPLSFASDNVEVLRVPCVGRVDPLHVLWAFVNGADGVLLGGCHPDDCRYESGSHLAGERIVNLKALLSAYGFDPRRLHLEWIKRGTPEAFEETVRLFAHEIRSLGTVERVS